MACCATSSTAFPSLRRSSLRKGLGTGVTVTLAPGGGEGRVRGRVFYSRSGARGLDADAEAPGGADGDALAQMRGGMHHADGREHGAPRASRHPLHGRFPPRTEAAQRARALGSLRGDLALPVRGPVGTDDLTRAAAHRVPIVAEGSHVHRRAQRGHLGHAHADAEVGARDLEAGRPAIVEYLLASAHDDVGHDVLGTRDVPHDPRERVEILARAYPHLLVRETGEGPVGDGERVATHRGRVYGAVLL